MAEKMENTFLDFMSSYEHGNNNSKPFIGVHLDQSRTVFCNDFVTSVTRLAKGEMTGNGVCRALLGNKGVGKSFLLAALCSFVKKNFKDITVVEISYQESALFGNPLTILDHIFEKLKTLVKADEIESCRNRVRDCRSVKPLESLLINSNVRLLVVVDEFQAAYTSACPNGIEVIAMADGLAQLMHGRVFCIITGSTKDFRKLCFAKATRSNCDLDKYVNYRNVDLNSTKYVPFTIHPMLDKKDFEALCRIFNLEPSEEKFCLAGGSPRAITSDQWPSRWTQSCKNWLQKKEGNRVFNALRNCVSSHSDQDDEDDEMYRNMKLISINDFKQEFRNDLEKEYGSTYGHDEWENLYETLYNMADAGVLRYLDETHGKLGFGSPMCFIQVKFSNSQILTCEEVFAMKVASGPYESTAENLTARFMSQAALKNKKLFPFNVDREYSDEQLVLKPDVVFNANCFYKEKNAKNQDVFGADFVVLERCTDGYVAHRLELKLGRSELLLERPDENVSVQSICSKLESKKEECTQEYSKAGIKLVDQKWYLCTTRAFPKEDARKYLESKGVKLFDRNFLSENVWPDTVKQLGRQYKRMN